MNVLNKLELLAVILGSLQVTGVLSNATESYFDDEENQLIPAPLVGYFNDEVQNFEAPEHLLQNYPYYLSGFDDENRPIWVFEFGKWDVRRVAEAGGKNFSDFDTYVSLMVLRFLNSTQLKTTAELPVTQLTVIADLEGYKFTQLASIPTATYYLKKLTEVLHAFEKLHASYCVNTNFVAEALLNLVRPVLGKQFEKLHIYGTNTAKWIPALLKVFPKDQIPEWYGGNKEFVPITVYG